MTRPCRSQEEMISRLISGDLCAEDKTKAETHLSTCPRCREYHEHLLADERLLASFAEKAISEIPSLEERILNRLTREPVPERRPSRWRWVPRFGYAWASAAAAAALLLLFLQLQKPPLTMAQVMETFEQQKWVHVRYDDGDESWICLEDGRQFASYGQGAADLVDYEKNIHQRYWPILGEYIHEWRAAEKPMPWERKTAWQQVMGTKFEAMNIGRKTPYREVHEEEIDGRVRVRIDQYREDALGRRILTLQVWADPETRLPVRKRERLFVDDRRKQEREYREGIFDFPETGPSSIYDLGVPRDLKVIRSDWLPEGDTDAERIVEAGKRARLAFPEHFRAVVWRADTPQTIDIIYWWGSPGSDWWEGDWSQVKTRQSRYFNVWSDPERYLPLPATIDKILEWATTQTPASVQLSDGERKYSARGMPQGRFDTGETPTVTVRHANTPIGVPVHQHQWPYIVPGFDTGFVFLEDAPDLPEGCIALRRTAAPQQIDYYIDPRLDHICMRKITWNKIGGVFEKAWEVELSDLVQLPEGQWYARRRTQINQPTSDGKQVGSGSEYITDVQVLAPDEFPLGVFSADEFLDGSYKVESPW